jgi:hypothetical protein
MTMAGKLGITGIVIVVVVIVVVVIVMRQGREGLPCTECPAVPAGQTAPLTTTHAGDTYCNYSLVPPGTQLAPCTQ